MTTRHTFATLLITHGAPTDPDLDELVKAAAPNLVTEHDVSRDVAAKLPIAAGDNPARIRTQSGFAVLCGVNPIQASSGKTIRHRLNRSGDRQANNALWVIATVASAATPPPAPIRSYLARRLYRDPHRGPRRIDSGVSVRPNRMRAWVG